uniref:CCHC-type domain-containing protein n=1 Tax=Ananas comosus var. bracteatus TaxID=296719 RepID=A0A6V7NPV8_ANACO|nr:unnamed protein product [Ananas comosus var. bracteatus]
MPITRSQFAGVDNAANFEEVETSTTFGSSEAQLPGRLRPLHRSAICGRCIESAVPAPSSSRAAPVAAPQEEVLAVPPVQRPPAGAAFSILVEGAERDKLMERLNEFRRCSPRVFDGEKVDHWIVEKWLMHMENLFRDTFVEERDRVWLATHHLDGEAYRWWFDFQEHPNTDLAAITWTRFKELLLAHYFLTSVKRKMEQDLRSLRQGTALWPRLRPSIYRFVQSSNLQTYPEVVDRALIVESGAAEMQERREGLDRGKAKRPATEGAGQTHSRRPPKYPRSQQRGRGPAPQRGGLERRRPFPCVICGGPHDPPQCPQRADRCFQCGQEGHVRTECPRSFSPASSTASAPALPATSQGTPSAQYQSGRQPVQRQSEGSRQARVAACMPLRPRRRRRLGMWLQVMVPEHTLDIREFCPSCAIRVEDWIMPVDLLALRKLGEFDVVLGMDWLTRYYTTIDCKHRTVTFREPGQVEVIFRGCQSSFFHDDDQLVSS